MQPQYSQRQPVISKRGKIILISVLAIIVLIIASFASLLIYYTVQLRYGSVEDVSKIEQNIGPSGFTLADSSKNRTTSTDKDVSSYIRSFNPTYGNPNAPLTIVMFIDFECPYCQAAYPDFAQIQKTYGPAVRFVFKHMPLHSIHPNAINAALASQCAHDQNKFWEYYNQLFTYKEFGNESLTQYARTLNLNAEQFESCLISQKHINSVQSDVTDGIDLGVRGTPTYFVNNSVAEGVVTKAQWDQIILDYIKK